MCEIYAFSRTVNHRYLSVNSHEVRRRVDGLAERFMADNYTQYGDRLKELVENLVTNPLLSNHYEYDIQWSILHFLLEVSKDPVRASAAQGKEQYQMHDNTSDSSLNENHSFGMNELMNSLMQYNIPVAAKESSIVTADESDLSVRFCLFVTIIYEICGLR